MTDSFYRTAYVRDGGGAVPDLDRGGAVPDPGDAVALACAAAAVRGGRVRRLSPSEGRFVVHPEAPEPAAPVPKRTTLWADHART